MARYKWNSAADWLCEKVQDACPSSPDLNSAALAIMDRCGISPRREATVVPAITQEITKALLLTLDAPSKLLDYLNSVIPLLDNDQIQDIFQDEMEADGFFQDLDIVNNLSRESCVELLEGICIECRDDEAVETLREAVQSNIEDGTLSYDEVAQAAK